MLIFLINIIIQWVWVHRLYGVNILLPDNHGYYSILTVPTSFMSPETLYFHHQLLDASVAFEKHWFQSSHTLALPLDHLNTEAAIYYLLAIYIYYLL